MSRYGAVISYEDGRLVIFDHDTGIFHASICQKDNLWSPSNSNFDPVSGLPTSSAISATGTSNPCSVAANTSLVYLADFQTCRVLAIDPATVTVFSTFGGRRGIGAGKIEPDGLLRSIVAVANQKVFVANNSAGSVLQYSSLGAFEVDYAISGWATALGLAFDQITGWAFDVARGRYWALAQSATVAYLFEVTTLGVATGTVINLTTRLATNLGLAVGGHNNSPADRVRTRGLFYHNGTLLLYADGHAVQVSLVSSTGDVDLVAQVNDLSPGNWSSDGTEVTYVLRDQANNAAVVYVANGATGALLRSYGASFSPPDGVDGHIATPWDCTIAPTAEDPSTRTSRPLSMRARIRNTLTHTLSMRASIRARVARTMQMRARILNLGPSGSQRTMQMRATIEEATTLADGVATSWELTDSIGEFSRGLALQTTGRAGFQVGDTLTLYAGYGTRRVKIFHGEIDDISRDLTTDQEAWTFTLREVGAIAAQARQITYVDGGFAKTINYGSLFPDPTNDIPATNASGVVIALAGQIGLTVSGGVPSYPLFGHVEFRNQNLIGAAQQLAEPLNLFPSQQYYPRLRDGAFEMLFANWLQPPSNGYVVTRSRIKHLTRKQTRYVESPNLVGLFLQVKGASVSVTIQDQLGFQTRVEYLKTVKQADATTPSAANTGVTPFTQENVTVEYISTEELWGDKVLTHTSETYSDQGGPMRLVAREVETTLYIEPTNSAGFLAIEQASAGPSVVALPLQVNSVTSGIDESDSQFKDLQITQTEYLYDVQFRLAGEKTTVTVFNTTTQHWELDSVQWRPQSVTTAGSVRISRFIFTPSGQGLTLGSLDRQQVGGSRPDPASASAQGTVVTTQITVPAAQVTFTGGGEPVVINIPSPIQGVWSYENGALGQGTCGEIYLRAVAEQALQTAGTYHWDEYTVDGVLDPNLLSGMAVRLEVDPGQFVDLIVESVKHTYNTNEALTSFTAKRLTNQDLP